MGDVIEVSWADMLEEEGILKRGFGSIPKYAMLDPNLSITAKAIYAYFCACAGSGTSTFPGRDTIVFHLSLNKDTYHKYSKELKESGYISVRKAAPRPGQGSKFTHNIYTIEANPKRFSEDPRYKKPGENESIAFEGIKSAGYGLIPRMVMEDPRLSAKAKALYAYLASYTGGGKSAFPEVKKTLYFLKISHSTYKILLKELVNVNYVVVIQRRVSGRMGVNDYFLVHNPSIGNVSHNTSCNHQKTDFSSPSLEMTDNLQKLSSRAIALPQVEISDAEKPDIKNHVTRESFGGEGSPPWVYFSDMGISDKEIQDTEEWDAETSDADIPDTQKSDSIINNTAINSSSITNLSTISQINQHKCKQTYLCDWFDGLDKIDLEREIKENMGFYAVEQGEVKFEKETYEYLISLVVDTISRKEETIKIGSRLHSREEVAERLYDLTYKEYEYVIESVANIKHEIRNLAAYYLASLFNAKEGLIQKIAQEVLRDWG